MVSNVKMINILQDIYDIKTVWNRVQQMIAFARDLCQKILLLPKIRLVQLCHSNEPQVNSSWENMAKHTAWPLVLVFDPNHLFHSLQHLVSPRSLHSVTLQCVQTETYWNPAKSKAQWPKINLPTMISRALVCFFHYAAKSKRMER